LSDASELVLFMCLTFVPTQNIKLLHIGTDILERCAIAFLRDLAGLEVISYQIWIYQNTVPLTQMSIFSTT